MIKISEYARTSFLFVAISLSACGYSRTTQLGDTDICIPNSALFSVGHSPVTKESNKPKPIVESMAIMRGVVQKDIPEYQGEFGSGDDIEYVPLYTAILRYPPLQKNSPLPGDSAHEYFFSKQNPNLVGYKIDPKDYWNAFEIHSDHSQQYWGICWYQGFDQNNYINCRRSLTIEGIEFQYYVSRGNIDIYPKIDLFLKEKVTKEWRCD